MATTLTIDPDLLNRALAVGGEVTKEAAVTRALEEYIAPGTGRDRGPLRHPRRRPGLRPPSSPGWSLLELVQGVRSRSHTAIRSAVDSLEFAEPQRQDYVEAAALTNTCRRHGVQLATIDTLVAALCISRGLSLLTADKDIRHAAEHVPLRRWSG